MADIVLQATGLTKYYGQKLALDHMDLQIEAGRICGLVGRNGSGKTTAIKLFLGFLAPTAGSSRIFGFDSQNLTPRIRQRVGYATEGHRLFKWMKIGDLAKYQKSFFPGQWDDKFFNDMMEYFSLSRRQKIKSLSNGQRSQVSLALTLAPHPELLIMDDPTLGLDAAIRRQFLEGMIELIMRQGRTVLFSSHILNDVERVAEQLVVIDNGVIRANCTVDEFRSGVKKVRVSFTSTVPERIEIEGCLNCRRRDKELELTLVGTADQIIAEWAQSVGADDVRIVPTNLEDQFIEYTEPPERKRLFEWERM